VKGEKTLKKSTTTEKRLWGKAKQAGVKKDFVTVKGVRENLSKKGKGRKMQINSEKRSEVGGKKTTGNGKRTRLNIRKKFGGVCKFKYLSIAGSNC